VETLFLQWFKSAFVPTSFPGSGGKMTDPENEAAFVHSPVSVTGEER